MEDELKNKTNNKKRMTKTVATVVGILLIVTSIILIILFLLRGNTTTTSKPIEDMKITALNCSSNSVRYPIFTYDNSNGRELNVKMTFNGDSLGNIALDYSLAYDSQNAVKASEAHNHAAMNISYGESGLQPDAFNTKYTMLEDGLRINLYTDGKEIDGASAKYFLIDLEAGLPSTLEEYRQNYIAQGLNCEVTE